MGGFVEHQRRSTVVIVDVPFIRLFFARTIPWEFLCI